MKNQKIKEKARELADMVGSYLNEVDQYAKHELGLHYYIRYMDDIIILHHDKKYLAEVKELLRAFLSDELRLDLNNKTAIRPCSMGVDFVGFTKLVLVAVLFTYFVGLYIGIKVTLIDYSQFGVLATYIATPTTTVIALYCWKAKAENIIKIKKGYPEETKDISVDLNNINI